MLRRSVGKLLRELHSSDQERSIARLDFMREALIPKCHSYGINQFMLAGGAFLTFRF